MEAILKDAEQEDILLDAEREAILLEAEHIEQEVQETFNLLQQCRIRQEELNGFSNGPMTSDPVMANSLNYGGSLGGFGQLLSSPERENEPHIPYTPHTPGGGLPCVPASSHTANQNNTTSQSTSHISSNDPTTSLAHALTQSLTQELGEESLTDEEAMVVEYLVRMREEFQHSKFHDKTN